MQTQDFSRDWEFQFGEPSSFPGMKKETRTVSLPFDFMIESDVSPDAKGGAENGFYKGNIGSYTKYLDVPEGDDGTYILSFDGCYGNTKVIVGGNLAARHHYGYSPFTVDITRFLKQGQSNRITVTANCTDEPNGRWYSGAGLYRKVRLLHAGKTCIVPEGIYVHADSITEKEAVLTAEVTVQNSADTDFRGRIRVSAAAKAKGEAPEEAFWQRADAPLTAEAVSDEVLIPAGTSAVTRVSVRVPDPALWDIDDPNLYAVRAVLEDAGENLTDTAYTVCGIRDIRIDAENGLRLNGRPVKLKGGCIHHDNGIIGAAACKDAEYRKVQLHKDNGFNALRFAHNPVSREILDACDEIGLLVIDEAFDTWGMEKNSFDFSGHFREEGIQELTNMVTRDRNHPSVFMWSIGNELPEQGGLSDGYRISAELAAAVRGLDKTRAVGGALCSFFRGLDDEDTGKYWKSVMENREEMMKNGAVNLDCPFGRKVWDPYTAPFVRDWDVVGYNYLRYQFEPSHAKHPERVICTTESKPSEFGDYWADALKYSYVIGDFEWTSMDYIGEAGIGTTLYVRPEEVPTARMKMLRASFPARTAGAGDFDLCGFEKPQLYYKKAVWGSKETFVVSQDPEHSGKVELRGRYGWSDSRHDWTWPCSEGAPVRLTVYSAAPWVEVFAGSSIEGNTLRDAVSLGKKPCGSAHNCTAEYDTVYRRGVILAVSLDEDGKEISRDVLVSGGSYAGMALVPDPAMLGRRSAFRQDIREDELPADGESLYYLDILAADESGKLVPYEEQEITIRAEGPAALIALGTGRSSTTENYTAMKITTFQGRALAVLRAGTEKGDTTVTVTDAAGKESRICIRSV